MYYNPLSWPQFERTRRHRYQVLVTYHQLQNDGVERRLASEIYFSLPKCGEALKSLMAFTTKLLLLVSYFNISKLDKRTAFVPPTERAFSVVLHWM